MLSDSSRRALKLKPGRIMKAITSTLLLVLDVWRERYARDSAKFVGELILLIILGVMLIFAMTALAPRGPHAN